MLIHTFTHSNLAEKAKHGGVNLDERGSQNRFLTAVAKAAA